MPETTITDLRVDWTRLRDFTAGVLVSAGLPKPKADTVAECLVIADLWGIGSHGVSRLPIYAERIKKGIVSGSSDPFVLTGGRAVCVVDGANNPGAVAGRFAMETAINAASDFGVGFAAVRNSNHFGVAGYYARMAVERGMIGICGTNAPITMAVWGAREPALGTNPITFAAPGGRFGEVFLDMSSSVVAKGKILVHARRGEPIPEGWALDKDGNPTTDSRAAADGVVLPFAGPKGSGLSLFIDIIAGVLSGAAHGGLVRDQYSDFEDPQNVGHFFLALDISAFMPEAEYIERIEAYFAEIKSRRRAVGVQEIFLPGEREALNEKACRTDGIPIEPSLLAALQKTAAEFGCEFPAE